MWVDSTPDPLRVKKQTSPTPVYENPPFFLWRISSSANVKAQAYDLMDEVILTKNTLLINFKKHTPD